MKVLVTGGCGFLGSYVSQYHVAQGDEVTALDNMDGGDLNNVRPLLARRSFRIEKASVADRGAVARAMHDVELVVHCAAQIHVDRSMIEPADTVNTNVVGTLNVLEEARRNRVAQVIYISSSEVYGPNQFPPRPMDESHPLDPPHVYGASKVAAERLCYAYSKQMNEPVTILRPFNFFGPRQRSAGYGGVIPIFLKRILDGKPPIIYGSGEQTRDYTYITDTLAAVLLAEGKPVYGYPVNIGTGCEISVNQIAALLLKLCGAQRQHKLKPQHVEERPGEVASLVCNPGLAESVYGWKPKVKFEDGLFNLWRWTTSGAAEAWTKDR